MTGSCWKLESQSPISLEVRFTPNSQDPVIDSQLPFSVVVVCFASLSNLLNNNNNKKAKLFYNLTVVDAHLY